MSETVKHSTIKLSILNALTKMIVNIGALLGNYYNFDMKDKLVADDGGAYNIVGSTRCQ